MDDLISDLELLRLEHCDNDEDRWYSCPKSGNCLDDRQGNECNCGTDRHNAILDGIIERVGQLWTV